MQPARPPRGLLANTGNTSDDMPDAFKTRKTSRRESPSPSFLPFFIHRKVQKLFSTQSLASHL